MKRVVILGRGGAGKSTVAAQLGTVTGLPVIELGKHFWSPDLTPIPQDQWTAIQRELVSGAKWILDGDLGPYDVVEVRLKAADTVILLDFPLWRCVSRAARRSRENALFWRWLITYRRRSLPKLLAAITANASGADVHVLRNPHDVRRFLTDAECGTELSD